MPSTVRPATHDDVEACRDVERAAGVRFGEVGMPDIAAAEPMSADGMRAYCDDGRAWVVDDDGAVVGYVLVDLVDGCAHVEQLSVDPAHQGRGLGRALLDHVSAWAASRSMPAVTLTTFRDVPWNAPLYAHLGFAVVDDLSPTMAEVVEHEAVLGLDPAIRVVMRRPC